MSCFLEWINKRFARTRNRDNNDKQKIKNMKKKVTAIIERADDGGYGIYTPELENISLFGYGLTEREAMEDLEVCLESILEYYKDENTPIPETLNDGEIEFDYKYDFSGFFQAYPIFNVSELANYLNINSSLLRKYKQGLAFASPSQKEKIEKGIHFISEKLAAVKF